MNDRLVVVRTVDTNEIVGIFNDDAKLCDLLYNMAMAPNNLDILTDFYCRDNDTSTEDNDIDIYTLMEWVQDCIKDTVYYLDEVVYSIEEYPLNDPLPY